MICLQTFLFYGIGLVMAQTTYPWFINAFLSGLNIRVFLAALVLFNTLYNMFFGIWSAIVAFASLKPTRGPDPKKIDEAAIKKWCAEKDADGKIKNRIVMNYIGMSLMSPGAFEGREATPVLINGLKWLQGADSAGMRALLTKIEKDAKAAKILDANKTLTIIDIEEWLNFLYDREKESKVTFCNLRQLDWSNNLPLDLKIGKLDAGVKKPLAEDEKAIMMIANEIRRAIGLRMGLGGTKGNARFFQTLDTTCNIMDMAEAFAKAGLGENVILMITDNKFDEHLKGRTNKESPRPEEIKYKQGSGTRENAHYQLAQLFTYIVTGGQKSEGNGYYTYNHTNFVMKATGMNGIFLLPAEIFKTIKYMGILDRNSNSLNLDLFVKDVKRMISNPNVVVMKAHREVTNTFMPYGDHGRLVEAGHGNSMLGFGDKTCTGWCNIMKVYYWEALEKLSMQDYDPKRLDFDRQIFAFPPNVSQLTEDKSAVCQQAQNAIALGEDNPDYALSEAMAHKLRESYSFIENEQAPPRWAGGLNGLLSSFYYQRINDLGPESIFERTARRNSERFYVSNISAFLNIALIPFGVVFDFLPFVGISALFLVIGVLFNQVLTLNGLMATIRESGFSKKRALVGGFSSGLFAVLAMPLLTGITGVWLLAATGALVILGGLFVGSPIGFARWLSQRIRDIVIFSSRFAIEVIAQFESFFGVGFEFVRSGAAAGYSRSDLRARTKAEGKLRLNLFKKVFLMGAILTGLNIFALSLGLDLTNVLSLFISLLFGISILIGPFVMENKPGKKIWGGAGDILGKLSGFGFGLIVIFSIHAWFTGEALFGIFSPWTLLLAVIPLVLWLTGGRYDQATITAQANDTKLKKKDKESAEKRLKSMNQIKGKAKLARKEKVLLKAAHPYTQRFIWEMKNYFIMTFCALIWFILVPVPDIFRVTLPGMAITTRVTFDFVWQSAVIIAVAAFVLIILGEVVLAHFKRKSLEKEYTKLTDAYRIKREQNQLYYPTQAKIDALFQQFLIFLDQKAYGYAEKALKGIVDLFSESQPAPATPQPPAPPVNPAMPPTPPRKKAGKPRADEFIQMRTEILAQKALLRARMQLKQGHYGKAAMNARRAVRLVKAEMIRISSKDEDPLQLILTHKSYPRAPPARQILFRAILMESYYIIAQVNVKLAESKVTILNSIHQSLVIATDDLIKAEEKSEWAHRESDRFRKEVILQEQRIKDEKLPNWAVPDPRTNENYIKRYQDAQTVLIEARRRVEILMREFKRARASRIRYLTVAVKLEAQSRVFAEVIVKKRQTRFKAATALDYYSFGLAVLILEGYTLQVEKIEKQAKARAKTIIRKFAKVKPSTYSDFYQLGMAQAVLARYALTEFESLVAKANTNFDLTLRKLRVTRKQAEKEKVAEALEPTGVKEGTGLTVSPAPAAPAVTEVPKDTAAEIESISVSYTHLTLPTILRV